MGTPRSLAALRWSPARMPRPPEYCGSTAVMPNSGEKYAIARGTSSPAAWRRWAPRPRLARGLAARVPPVARQVPLQVLARGVQPAQEVGVRRERLKPGRADG